MLRLAKLLLCTAAFLLLLPALPAQQLQDQPTHPLFVNVFDRDGRPLRDLTKDSFRIRVNGKSATVASASFGLAPRRIVVLLDMSGSMGGASEKNKKWQIARDALQNVLEQTPPDVPLALLTFSSQVHDVIDFSQSRSSLAAWLKNGPSQRSNIKGPTALRDALLAALKMLQPVRQGDAIYAVTDGGDTTSHVSFTQARRALSESGVRLFLFLFEDQIFPTDEEKLGRDELREMARDSGGFVFGVRSGGMVPSGFPSWNTEYDYYEYNDDTRNKIKLYAQTLNGLVNGFYTVQVEAPQSRKDAKVKLEIVDKTGAVRKDVTFTYPSFFPAKK